MHGIKIFLAYSWCTFHYRIKIKKKIQTKGCLFASKMLRIGKNNCKLTIIFRLSHVYSPDPQTTKRNRAKSQGPTGDPSSCDF